MSRATVTPGRKGAVATVLAVLVCGVGAAGGWVGAAGTAGAAATPPATGWSAAAPPLSKGAPAGAHPLIKRLTCPAPGFCVAVGDIGLSKAPTRDLAWAAVLTGGSWSAVTLPLPKDATGSDSSSLAAVSCPTRAYCVAVGSFAATVGQHASGLVETYRAGLWSAGTELAPDTLSSVLSAVDCSATGLCNAVGPYQNAASGSTGAAVFIDAGSAVASTPLPLPSNARSGATRTAAVVLRAISCATPNTCLAGGSYQTTGGAQVALLDAATGGSWADLPVAGLPSNTHTSQVTSVSCAVDGTCEALVEYQTSPHGTTDTDPIYTGTLIATWSAGELSTLTPPLPKGVAATTFDLDQLSCPTAGACTAVGFYRPPGGGSDGLVDTLTGATWSASSLPLPADTDTGAETTVTVNGVDCPGPGQCWAVGQYHVDGIKTAFVATLTTGTWSSAPLPLPGGATISATSAGLTVSCADETCDAAGFFYGTTLSVQTMLLTLPASFSGYDLVGSDGGVFVFPEGTTTGFYGSLPGIKVTPAAPVVGMVPTVSDKGYFLVGADGGVYAFGNAPFLGSLPGLHVTPAAPVTGIVAANGDRGYFLVGADGGVYSFGTVPFLGSLPGQGKSVSNIVGIAATPSGDGYWLVGNTGTVYAFGAARQFGAATGLASPVSAIAGTPTGGGYWVVTANGSVKAFGDAGTFDPATLPALDVTPHRPVIGIVRTAETNGYWLIGADGGIFAFGTAPFVGSLPGLTPPVVVGDIVAAVPT